MAATDKGSTYYATLSRCAKEFQLSYVRGIIPHAQVTTPRAFGTGIGTHAMRDRWFKLNFDTSEKAWRSMRDALREEAERQKLPLEKVSLDESENLMLQYVEHYSKLPKPKVMAAEMLIELDFMSGRVDDASYYPEAGGQFCLGELKTTSSTPSQLHKHYLLALQPLHYFTLWRGWMGWERKDQPYPSPVGLMLDVIQKPKKPGGKANFERFFISVPEHALNWYEEDVAERAGQAALTDWNSAPVRSPTQCARAIPGNESYVSYCPFRDLCLHGRSAAGQYMFKNGSSLLSWKPIKGKETPPWE